MNMTWGDFFQMVIAIGTIVNTYLLILQYNKKKYPPPRSNGAVISLPSQIGANRLSDRSLCAFIIHLKNSFVKCFGNKSKNKSETPTC